jgi:hypothetical protein
MYRTRRAALALALSAAFAGCTDDPFAPDLAPQGDATFTYSGAISGSFEGSGRLNRRNPNAGAWAVGELQDFEDTQILGVFAQERREDLLIDGLILEWEGAQVGSVTCDQATVTCPFSAVFVLGTDRFSGTSEAQYSKPFGTLTVTTLTDSRAQGTFSFSLRASATGTAEPPVIQVSGSFDVPLNVLD